MRTYIARIYSSTRGKIAQTNIEGTFHERAGAIAFIVNNIREKETAIIDVLESQFGAPVFVAVILFHSLETIPEKRWEWIAAN